MNDELMGSGEMLMNYKLYYWVKPQGEDEKKEEHFAFDERVLDFVLNRISKACNDMNVNLDI